MEPNIFRYIWMHTRREQIGIVLIILVSMIPYYMAFDLPKQIVNGPLQGTGFESAGSTLAFMDLSFDLPFLGSVQLTDGWQLERVPLLWALSLTFLALVIVNGWFKYVINTRKGLMGERLLRRVRYELVDRILRFPPARFRQAKAGEVSSMVKDEVEPLGGFAGDAFTQPVMLGGQALTALVFIFVQHFWLGMVAALMAGIQVAIIPRMRRRLIVLGRQRQVTARELSGRVAEMVDGIQTIHANDATNWERADLTARLGRIFRIRYDIYQWKFLVKFLNNFIAQLTPFLFYTIGGLLTIRGTLDVGQLVAVINAYKDLPGPLKELIDWDLARQDMQVKYEQVVEQFAADSLIDPARQDLDVTLPAGGWAPLALRHVTVRGDVGAVMLDDVSLELAPGQTLAAIGGSSDGGPVLGDLLGGIVAPSGGAVLLGERDMRQMPESVTGRLIGYSASNAYLFAGTVMDNLLYGLKRRPGPVPEDEPEAARTARAWRVVEARRAGNPVLDREVDWIDHDAVQPEGAEGGLIGSVCAVLDVVGLGDDIINLAIRARMAPEAAAAVAAEVADDVLALRARLHEELNRRELGRAIITFAPDRYNEEATIGENLLFGVPSPREGAIARIVSHPFFRESLDHADLLTRLFDLGWQFARMTVDLFSGMDDNPELLESLTYMSPEELPDFERIVGHTRPGGFAGAARADRLRLIRLAMFYVERKYRFGLLDDGLREAVIAGRRELARRMPETLRDELQPYAQGSYLTNATLLENILFGKVNRRVGRAEEQVAAVTRELMREAFAAKPALLGQIMQVGLAHDIGSAGRKLSPLQRQKLILARSLIRRSTYYVFNEPLAGADPAFQGRMIDRVLAFLAAQPRPAGVVWVLANEALAGRFDRVARFAHGRLAEITADGAGDAPPAAAPPPAVADAPPPAGRA